MINILNRLAWGVSFCLGLSFSLAILSDDSVFDEFALFVIMTLMASLVAKKLFFPLRLIRSALDDRSKDPGDKYLGAETLPTAYGAASSVFAPPAEKPAFPSAVTESSPSVARAAAPLPEKEQSLSEEIKEYLSLPVQAEELPKEKPVEIKKAYNPDSDILIKGMNSVYGIFADFFRENVLAKIGGIMLFLAVLFLMQLVYTRIGPIGKLLLGFCFGFSVFGAALYLEAKKYYREARVLMGISVLINYLVILSGRYLIGEGIMAKQFLLNESLCFFLLIINTIFAISVALAHNSRVILFFSFGAAYANPFLVSDNFPLSVYTACVYSLLVSLGAFYLSRRYFRVQAGTSLALFWTAFLGGNLLSIAAPSESANEWLIKLALLSLLSLLAAFQAQRRMTAKVTALVLAVAYAFFFVLVMQGHSGIGASLRTPLVTLSALAFLLLSSSGAVYGFMQASFGPLLALLLVPMLFILSFFQLGVLSISSLPLVLTLALLFYVLVFSLILNRISQSLSLLYYSILAFFVFLLADTAKSLGGKVNDLFSDVERYGIALSLLLFFASALYFSRKRELALLYPLSALATAFILPIIFMAQGTFRLASLFLFASFLLVGLAWPFINRRLFEEAKSLMGGFLIFSLFAVYGIFYFSVAASDLRLGFYFSLLALFFFALSYLAFLIVVGAQGGERALLQREKLIDTVYPLLGISLSLFSLAIAYLFSDHHELVAIVYFAEASLLYYFYSQRRYTRIYVAALILHLVGLIKLISLIDSLQVREYGLLFSSFALLIFLASSLRFFSSFKDKSRLYHDLLHIISVVLIGAIILQVTPDTSMGWDFFALSVYIFLLSIIYSISYSRIVVASYIAALLLILLLHSASLELISDRFSGLGTPFYMIFQYAASLFFLFPVLAFKHLPALFGARNEELENSDRFLSIIALFYAVIVSTEYFYLMFDKNVFVITIYWGIIALALLSFGIQNDRIKYRTIGLYILAITVLKILLYDIWSGLDDAILRVIALVLVGAVMILVSTLYSRKYGNRLSGEFDPKNLAK
jgi:hypothetical protein